MKNAITALAVAVVLSVCVPAQAVVILIYAGADPDASSRPYLVGKGYCVEADGSAVYNQYMNDESGCTAAAKEWIPAFNMVASKGHVVGVYDESYVGWGTKEVLPPASGGKFVRIRITDKTVAQAEKYLENNVVGDVIKSRTKWKVLVSNLPAGVKTQLNQTGYYENTWENIRGYIYDTVNGTTE